MDLLLIFVETQYIGLKSIRTCPYLKISQGSAGREREHLRLYSRNMLMEVTWMKIVLQGADLILGVEIE